MHKALVFLIAFALQSGVALADYQVNIYNNNESKSNMFPLWEGTPVRWCVCVRNTQTGFIEGVNGGLIKLFSSSDCTGNYDTIGSNEKVGNANWVNSFSFGRSGISSNNPNGVCPNYLS
jgi:hypothetical protein